MKRLCVVAIVGQFFLIFLFSVYAYFQRKEVIKQRKDADAIAKIREKNRLGRLSSEAELRDFRLRYAELVKNRGQ